MGSASSFGCPPFVDSVGIVDGIEIDDGTAASFTPAIVALLTRIYECLKARSNTNRKECP